MTSGLHGKIPAATRNVPPYCTELRSLAMSMIYPTIATVHPININGPLICNWSLPQPVSSTTKKASIFGGTVKSCAVTIL